MHKLAIGVGIVVALVLVPQPAEGKCLSEHSVAIRGIPSAPGLELTREQWGVARNDSSPTAVVLEGLLGRYPKDPHPPERLGPRYRISHVLDVADLETGAVRVETVEQDLYPRTSAGPMTYTPPQEWRSCTGRVEDIDPGWQPFPAELVANLRSFGLRPALGARGAEADANRTPWAWALITAAGIAIAGVGTTGAMVALRGRRRKLGQGRLSP